MTSTSDIQVNLALFAKNGTIFLERREQASLMKTRELVTIVMRQVTLPTSVLMRRHNTSPNMRGGLNKGGSQIPSMKDTRRTIEDKISFSRYRYTSHEET
jgi:hypothetical protein